MLAGIITGSVPVPNSVLEAIKMGLWDFEPADVETDEFTSTEAIPGSREKLDILSEHCSDVGRDPATIEKTISFPIVLRDDAADATAAYMALLAANGTDEMGDAYSLRGSPIEVADAIRPYQEMGFGTVISRMPAPYDPETIDRMASVGELLAG